MTAEKNVLVLLGAGASYGCTENCENTPPLGKDLYLAIKDIEIGSRFQFEKAEQLFSPANATIANSMTIEKWVEACSTEANQLFLSGDFEGAIGVLSATIAEQGKGRTTIVGFGGAFEQNTDDALIDKLMVEAICHLYSFSLPPKSFYGRLAACLPDGSAVATLNYDCLWEEACSSADIKLVEPKKVLQNGYHGSGKNVHFYQLHGGATLVNLFTERRSLYQFTIQTDKVERINKSLRIGHVLKQPEDVAPFIHVIDFSGQNLEQLRWTMSPQEFRHHFAQRSVFSIYNSEKTNFVAPQIIQTIQQSYADYIEAMTENCDLFVIGCRLLNHDQHIWGPVQHHKGNVYWCGEDVGQEPFKGNYKFLGSTFAEAIGTIESILSSVPAVR